MPRFLIAPFKSGLQNNLKPWLIPDDAFEQMNNMYVFRGRMRKRFGTEYTTSGSSSVNPTVAQLTSRLRINLGNTDGNGDISGTAPGSIFKVGQLFSIGEEIFTVTVAGTPGTMLTTGSATTHTYNTTTGAYDIQGADAGTACYFYPAEPVMGIWQYEASALNNEPTYVFDTQFCYFFSNGWEQLGSGSWTTANGDDSDFYWATTWQGATPALNIFFAANFVVSDGIQYWNGTAWATLNPSFNAAGDTIETARVILPFKDRLILLNVVENISSVDTPFGNRCRFSQNGSPLDASAWLEDTPGRGGYLDAPTQERIVSAEFLKDRLIVFFERSTWELVYTGNEILPFRWQQINTELGVESTFSLVPFDQAVIGVGNVGVHACNGANVTRIDDKIPDEVFDIHNENDGILRVHGIRDYFTEMVYWTFPSAEKQDTFPKKVLAYNYETGSWAFFDDSITAFGYIQNQSNDVTWQNSIELWEEANFPWSSGVLQSQFLSILAGNQEGFVLVVNPDLERNAGALQISAINTTTNTFTIIDHNLSVGDYVALENVNGITITRGDASTDNIVIFMVTTITDDDNVVLQDISLSGTYIGGGTAARVSNPELLSKQYNFFISEGRNLEVTNVDFYVDKTTHGEISIDYYASSSDVVLGTSILETRPYSPSYAPLEQTQDRLWHRVYLDSEGDNFQIRTYLNNDQMINKNIAWSQLAIHAIMFDAKRTRSRLE